MLEIGTPTEVVIFYMPNVKKLEFYTIFRYSYIHQLNIEQLILRGRVKFPIDGNKTIMS